MNLSFGTLKTPVGNAFAAVNESGGVAQFRFLGQRKLDEVVKELERCGHAVASSPNAVEEVATQIDEYFARKRRVFELATCPEGTAFQKRVWSELCKIEYGQTITYGELAKRVGMGNGARAVGSANGRNPVALLVPCHRVIGSGGALVGYGGGLEIKQALLMLETGLPWP